MPATSASKPEGLAKAVARQIRTELTRRDLDINALIGVIGKRSYVYTRLSVDGATHALSLNELSVIAGFLGMTPLDLLTRANEAPEVRSDTIERGYTTSDERAIRRTVKDL